MNSRGEMLLNSRDGSKDFYPNLWDLVGGTVEAGETAEACMQREILEETGEALDAVEWLADFDLPLDDAAVARLHLYLGEIDKPAGVLLVGEGQEHRFFDLCDLDDVDVVPGTRAVLRAYAGAKAGVGDGIASEESSPHARLSRLVAAMARNDSTPPGPAVR